MNDAVVEGDVLRVLLVEDDADHVELVRRSLREHRVANTLYVVTDGEAALDFLHQRGAYADPGRNPRPHLVLLDLRLPRIDGLAVLKEIKAAPALSRVPVVILTTSAAESDVAAAYDLKANSYLVKPVNFEKFVKLIDDFGFYWLAWNRYPELRAASWPAPEQSR
jgi:CheY-like chemotaxis protein